MTDRSRRLTRPNGSFDLEAALDNAEALRRNETRAMMTDLFSQVARAFRQGTQRTAGDPGSPQRSMSPRI